MLLLFSCQVVSNSSRHHGLQHTRLPCPWPSLGVFPSSYPLDRWCHPTISSSLTLFSFCLPHFPASGSFPMSRLCTSSGQSIGSSASASVLPMRTVFKCHSSFKEETWYCRTKFSNLAEHWCYLKSCNKYCGLGLMTSHSDFVGLGFIQNMRIFFFNIIQMILICSPDWEHGFAKCSEIKIKCPGSRF